MLALQLPAACFYLLIALGDRVGNCLRFHLTHNVRFKVGARVFLRGPSQGNHEEENAALR